jgi:hypothetical protein
MFHGFFNSGGLALVAPRIPATKGRENVIVGRMLVDDRPYLALVDVKVCCVSSHTAAVRIRLTIARLTTPHKNGLEVRYRLRLNACWNSVPYPSCLGKSLRSPYMWWCELTSYRLLLGSAKLYLPY